MIISTRSFDLVVVGCQTARLYTVVKFAELKADKHMIVHCRTYQDIVQDSETNQGITEQHNTEDREGQSHSVSS